MIAKRETKTLAAEFASLKPRPSGDANLSLWLKMVEASSQIMSSQMGLEFKWACNNGGIWPK